MRRIDKHNAGELHYVEMKKIGTTRMAPIEIMEPTTVETKEGDYVLKVGWKGAIALDADGDPYPVAANIIEASYEPVQPSPASPGPSTRPT